MIKLLKIFKLFNVVGFAQKLIKFIDQVEAITSVIEDVSRIIEREAKKNNSLLSISAKKIDKIERVVHKIDRFDKKLEQLKKDLR